MNDEILDRLLNARKFEPANDNLAYRIITKAKNRSWMNDQVSIWDLVKGFLSPKQAFAMAIALIVGLYVGGMLTQSATADSEYQVSSFLEINGDPL